MSNKKKNVEAPKNENLNNKKEVIMELTKNEIYLENKKTIEAVEDFDNMPIVEKKSIIQTSNDIQKYLKEENEKDAELKKALQLQIKGLTKNVSDRKTEIKTIANQFGAIKNPTREDYALFLLNNPTTIQDLLETCVNFYGFDMKSIVASHTTFNALFGSNDSTTKFKSFKDKHGLIAIEQSEPNMPTLYQNETEIVNFTIEDFEEHANEYKNKGK